jgi:hypothetical protein
MATHTPHSKSRVALRGLAISIATLCLSPLAPTTTALASTTSGQNPASSYGWPIKPFHRQHPVRGFFGDPRVEGHARQFHFGVDISAPDGTAVYATISGRIYVEPERPETVAIRSDDASVVFAYWHLVPTVRTGQRAIAYETVIGRIGRGWGHVHFAESHRGRYANPLRPGGMTPFADTKGPVVRAIQVERNGRPVPAQAVAGRVDLVVDAFDRTPQRVAAPWRDLPVMPAVVRWRLRGPIGATTHWRTAVDFRRTIPAAGAFESIFARWTRQNHPNQAGRYRIYLKSGWDTSALPRGSWRIEVTVADAGGNTAGLSTLLRLVA